MGLGDVFVRSISREIGRNVGKGISNDLFGDWHATPVRGASSSSKRQGWDIRYVQSDEYDVSTQPGWKPNWGYFGSFFWNFIISVFLCFTFFGPLIHALFSVKDFTRKKMNMWARVPMRRQDGRTKTGYRDLNTHTYVELKSKRLLTEKEKTKSRIAGSLELLGIICGILLFNYYFSWVKEGVEPSFFNFSAFFELYEVYFGAGESTSTTN